MLYVIDDFLKDGALKTDIVNTHDFFPGAMPGSNIGQVANDFHYNDSCSAPFMFWRGWWQEETKTTKQRLIRQIWENSPWLPCPLEEIAGFEYWARTFGPGQYLAPHVDEDTFAYSDRREFKAPAIGCVWYGFTDDPGDGFLELHEARIDGYPVNALEQEFVQPILSSLDKRERIAYRPNRLIVFEAGRRLHETTVTSRGQRNVLVVNVWLNSEQPDGLINSHFVIEEMK